MELEIIDAKALRKEKGAQERESCNEAMCLGGTGFPQRSDLAQLMLEIPLAGGWRIGGRCRETSERF